MSRLQDMVDAVRDYLDSEDWKYEYDAASQVIRAGVGLKCKLKSVRIGLRFTEDGYISVAYPSMNVSEEYRASVAEFITRANYGVKNGNFEMDYRDGEIRYKVYTNYKGLDTLPTKIIEDSIIIPGLMFERYGDGFAALMFGFSSAAEEIERIEGK